MEGFEVELSENQKTINVTINRVKDINALLEKTLQADLNSFSAASTINQTIEASSEENSIHMLMELKMDDMTSLLIQTSSQQADPPAQLELMKKFNEGVHVIEYDDKYVMM
ncbi:MULTISPECIES: hypothetical protein [unclassified Sporosarcina]|uniref:hypothetical protein n=1 Tax=unclassified Sporosarcina TaxID=2647733 RepID=UPI00203F1701|nr:MULTISPECIES: hypothetical protein [unclassified Sporosarcina]GKV65909.1 hypothetical protein NCCP2331_20620 [Sporosarcina sp. NCCP-2331]GLB56091.1 hypothetical protein NCCP2378_18780 [Sporosarcina sp. NCCP-2378]